jgi:hypothetical protein
MLPLLSVLVLLVPCCLAKDCPPNTSIAQTLAMPSSNGCSKPPGMSVEGEQDFTYCCDRHDVCYATCGIDKSFCEEDFGKCMTNLCATAFPTQPNCRGAASVYQMGVTMFGGQGFMQLQEEHCECIPDDDVVKRYRTILEGIYASHAPNKTQEETGAVLDKALTDASPSTLRKTFYRVLKKYDAAIVHVDGRVGRDPVKPVKPEKKKTAKKEL